MTVTIGKALSDLIITWFVSINFVRPSHFNLIPVDLIPISISSGVKVVLSVKLSPFIDCTVVGADGSFFVVGWWGDRFGGDSDGNGFASTIFGGVGNLVSTWLVGINWSILTIRNGNII